MTDTPTDDMRRDFEAWADANMKTNHYSLERHVRDGQYLWVHVDDAWKVWQAAYTRPVPAGLVALRDALVAGFVYADDAGKLLEITGHHGSTEQKADVAKIKAAIELCDALVKAHAQPAAVSLAKLRDELDVIASASLQGQGVAGRLQAVITAIDEGKYVD